MLRLYEERATALANALLASELLRAGVTPPNIAVEVSPAEFNAQCSRLGTTDYQITINAGAAFLLEDLFFRLLSQPGTWRDVGEHQVETAEVSLHNYYRNAEDLFYQGTVSDRYSRPLPKCEIRQHYAAWLSALAWDFLVLHELTHVLHGHLDLLGTAINEPAAVARRMPAAQSRLSILERQALEMDADAFGAAWTMQFRRLDAPNERLKRPRTPGIERLFIALDLFRAVYSSFLLFCGERDPHNTTRTHPPPRVRQSLMMSGLMNWVGKGNETKFGVALVDEISRMEGYYTLLTGIDIDRARTSKRLQDRHALSVIKTWKDVHPRLAKTSIVDLPSLPDDY